jgi:hypothetical protein
MRVHGSDVSAGGQYYTPQIIITKGGGVLGFRAEHPGTTEQNGTEQSPSGITAAVSDGSLGLSAHSI